MPTFAVRKKVKPCPRANNRRSTGRRVNKASLQIDINANVNRIIIDKRLGKNHDVVIHQLISELFSQDH